MVVDFLGDCLEFRDRTGTMRTTYGCSLYGLKEFHWRTVAIAKLLKEVTSLSAEYANNPEFKHHCDRSLQLNGIDPEWLTEAMFRGLLFEWEGNAGLLHQLNAPKPSTKPSEGGKLATIDDTIAALWRQTEDLNKALEYARTLPVKELISLMESRSAIEEEVQERALQERDPQAYQMKIAQKRAKEAREKLKAKGSAGIPTPESDAEFEKVAQFFGS